MDNLVSWTVRGDHEAERYAGTVRYKTEFVWEADTKKAVLNLGRVKDCARITLNGKTIGTTLGPVFKINVNNLVKGKNTLLVDVTNVAANRIRDLDRRGVVWRKFYDINLVNLNYEEFDSSDWQVREAGLLGPVSLTPIKTI